jgi:hypothetical protein
MEDGQLKYVRTDKLVPGMSVLSGITPNGHGVIVY